MSTDLLEKDDEISRLKMEVSTSNMRSKEQFESRLRDELEERERQFNKLSSDYNTLRSMVTML
jgi:predicted RNase H-like nuclease (RuvC/YqgF family)